MKRIDDRRRPARGADRLARTGSRRSTSTGSGGRRADHRPRAPRHTARRRGLGARVRLRPGRPRLGLPADPGRRARRPAPPTALLGTIPKALLDDLAANCNGEVADDAGPARRRAPPTAPGRPIPTRTPTPSATPSRSGSPSTSTATPTNFGRYRKTLFAYDDDGNLAGWPRPIGTGSDAGRYVTGSGGEVSPRLYDVDGDNELDVVQADLERRALRAATPTARRSPSFNGGQPGQHRPLRARAEPPGPGGAADRRTSRCAVPAIGDIDGDLEPEIVATAGEHVYAWDLDGSRVDRLPGRAARPRPLGALHRPGAPKPCFDAGDRGDHRATTTSSAASSARPRSPTSTATGASTSSPARSTSTSTPGTATATCCPASRASSRAPGPTAPRSSPRRRSPSSTATATGAARSESYRHQRGDRRGDPRVVPGRSSSSSTPALARRPARTRSTRSTATATPVAGWPVKVGVAAGDLLPLVLPGHDAAVLDARRRRRRRGLGLGGDLGDAGQGRGSSTATAPTIRTYENAAGEQPRPGPVLNLADYPSVGDILGDGQPAVLKGGLTLNGAANLLAVNQNLPFSHVEQAWDPTTGAAAARASRSPPTTSSSSRRPRSPGSAARGPAAPGAGRAPASTSCTPTGPAGSSRPAGRSSPAAGSRRRRRSATPTATATSTSPRSPARAGRSSGTRGVATPATSSNEEWWTFHHDERCTANYGDDGRPPGTPAEPRSPRSAGGAVDRELDRARRRLALRRQADRLPGDRSPTTRSTHPTDGRVIATRTGPGAAGQAVRGHSAAPGRIRPAPCRPLPRRGRQLGAVRSAAIPGVSGRAEPASDEAPEEATPLGLCACHRAGADRGRCTALGAFPYSRPGGDPQDYKDLYLNAGQTPNDLAGDANEWKFAATPEPSNAAINQYPVELCGVRGAHVVDASAAVETAWQTTTGRPDVAIAVLDSGIKWNDARRDGRPAPQDAAQHGRAAGPTSRAHAGLHCASYDCQRRERRQRLQRRRLRRATRAST